MIHDGKPSIDDVMAHYGIKGMKWGVHKKEDPSSGHGKSSKPLSDKDAKAIADFNELSKKWMAATPPENKTHAEAAQSLTENHHKFNAKFQPDDHSPDSSVGEHHLTDKQKTAIKVGVGVAVVGGLMLYGAHANSQKLAEMERFAGKEISNQQFAQHVMHSKFKTWGFSGYIQPSSHLRDEITLPAGHTFHRISTGVETSFKQGTYATHSTEDFHRYIAAFRQEKGTINLQHITFTAEHDIKIPKLATVLETVQEHLTEKHGTPATAQEAASLYKSWSGGSWSSIEHQSFFNRLAVKGYHGIVDEMDAGVIGETPLVLFRKESFSSKVSNPLTEDLIKKAESSLIELTNRKL